MSKGGSLTGGTGDVNPQQYRLGLASGIAITTTGTTATSATQAFPVPISRLKQGTGKATVMEILKLRWTNTIGIATNQAPHNAYYLMQGILSTKAPSAVGAGISPFPNANDGSIIDSMNVTNVIGVTGTAQVNAASYDNETPNYHDLTDGAGHGILVATDNIWLTGLFTVGSVDTTSYTGTGFCNVSIFYRFKDVSLQEYIGIVQSQQ